MTTPTPPGVNPAAGAGSRLLGTNALQAVVDKLTQAVDKLASVTQGMSSSAGSGSSATTTSYHTTGQTFTSGSFPRMSPAAAAFNAGGASYATAPGGAMSNPAGTLAQAGQSIGQGAMAMMQGKSSQYGQQITMNQYAAMSMLGAGPGVSLSKGFSQMYAQAFGHYNSNMNALATNPADAAQMYSNLQGIAGSPYVMSNSLGRAGFGAAAGFGVANPALGGAGASSAAAQVYSGQTSMLMRMYGYGATPRAGMGQANPMSMGQTAQTILQRAYGGRTSVSQSTLNASIANSNGYIWQNLQAIGLDPKTMGPALQTYNKLFSQGLNPGQAQTLLNDAAHNQNYRGQSAQKLLSNKYGIPTSDLQKLKDTTAVTTGRTSGEMGGFDSAVSSATSTVQKFDEVLSNILKVTGLGSAVGATHGFTGTMNSVGGVLGGLFSKGTRALGTLTGIGGGAGGAPAGTTGHGTPGSTSNSNTSRQAATAIKDAESQLGRAYVWGGDNPSVGFDCSGLVEWAYGQAGIKLPRTSQAQWAALKGRSVAMNKIQAGDILFSAGSDGSPNSPGHEAMAISSSQIIEAPYTGANIRIRALNAGEWSHAARPTGSMNAAGSGGGSGSGGPNGQGTSSGGGTGKGNSGLGMSVGNYGSSDELSNVASALMGGISGGSGMSGFGGTPGGGPGAGGSKGKGPAGKGNMNISTAGGGSASANRALGQKMAKQMYGWTGAQWKALDSLWGTYESGWRDDAQNPGSTAYGIAQFLDSTWKGYGPKTSNPGLQIKYGMEYVHDRYKDPIGALKFELSHTPHWYADGIDHAKAGMALVGERGPELVRLGGGQQVLNAGKTADILKGSHAKPGQTPWSSGTTQQLFLAPVPQNQGRLAGKCEVHLNMPPGAIVVHAQGDSTDVSNSVRQIMAGITRAMADDEMVKKIMAGVMG